MKADRLAASGWANPKPPRLNIDACIPEAGFARGDGNIDGTVDVEADKLVERCGVRHIHSFAVDGDGERRRTHLSGHGRCLNLRRGSSDWDERKSREGQRNCGYEERSKNRQA